MTSRFNPEEWVRTVPPQRRGLFQTPYAEPASIVARETGSDLEECFGCGQLREDVAPVDVGLDADRSLVDVCPDCRALT